MSSAHFSSVMPRIAFRSALGSLGSALAARSQYQCIAAASLLRSGLSGYVPPEDLGCSWGCVFAHSALACLINDSLWLYAFCSALIFSRADIDSCV